MALSVADLSVLRPAVSRSAVSRRAGANSIAPTDLRPADLLRITDEFADRVLGGDFDRLLPATGLPAGERWATRLHLDDDVDVWLISWVPDRSTELHDHAGSIGALTVLSGVLSEFRWVGGELKHRRLDAGDQASFPLGWVHDVVQAPGDEGGPTLSVHAYSPPLTAMSYYEPTTRGTLRRTRTELTGPAESGRGGDR